MFPQSFSSIPSLKQVASLSGALLLGACFSSQATAAILMNASDSFGDYSFYTGVHWVGGAAPVGGEDYVADGYAIRTNQTTAFVGDSLSLVNGGNLIIKNPNGTTVGNLISDNGKITAGASPSVFLYGALAINAGGLTVDAASGSISLYSVVSGAGLLTVDTTSANALRLRSSNTFSGGTQILDGSLEVSAANGLGTGNVVAGAGTLLTFTSLTVDTFVDDSAQIVLADTALLALDFTGTDTIAGLSLDGGLTNADIGIWGAIGNGSAEFTSALITGSGLLNVTSIPEPSTSGAALGVIALLAAVRSRRRA